MRHIQPVRRPCALGDDLAVAHHEHGMRRDGIRLGRDGFIKAQHGIGAYALGLRGAAGQRLRRFCLRQLPLLQRISIGWHVFQVVLEEFEHQFNAAHLNGDVHI